MFRYLAKAGNSLLTDLIGVVGVARRVILSGIAIQASNAYFASKEMDSIMGLFALTGKGAI